MVVSRDERGANNDAEQKMAAEQKNNFGQNLTIELVHVWSPFLMP